MFETVKQLEQFLKDNRFDVSSGNILKKKIYYKQKYYELEVQIRDAYNYFACLKDTTDDSFFEQPKNLICTPSLKLLGEFINEFIPLKTKFNFKQYLFDNNPEFFKGLYCDTIGLIEIEEKNNYFRIDNTDAKLLTKENADILLNAISTLNKLKKH